MRWSDQKLRHFASMYRSTLGRESLGNCLEWSGPLSMLLNMADVPCCLSMGIVELDDMTCAHAWVTMADGRVLDLTLAQFHLLYKKRFEDIGWFQGSVYHGPLPKFITPQPAFKVRR